MKGNRNNPDSKARERCSKENPLHYRLWMLILSARGSQDFSKNKTKTKPCL